MNVLDVVILIIAVLFGINGFFRGLVHQVFFLVAIFAGIALGMHLSPYVGKIFHVFTKKPDLIRLLGFLVSFILVATAVGLLGRLVHRGFRLVQLAILYRGKEKVSMSTRGGQFVSLRELRDEVGNDACRFFYVLRRPDQHMDFDLELAKSQSSDNPVYYIQYAHARICSIFRQVSEKNLDTPDTVDPDYNLLVEPRETDLLRTLSRFPEVVELAAASYEPHQVAYYLRDLANEFHSYYNAHPFLSSEDALRQARLGLIDAVRIVIANGLDILGGSAPEAM